MDYHNSNSCLYFLGFLVFLLCKIKKVNYKEKFLILVGAILWFSGISIWYNNHTKSLFIQIFTEEKVNANNIKHVLIYPKGHPYEEKLKSLETEDLYKLYDVKRYEVYKIVDKKIIDKLIDGVCNSRYILFNFPIDIKPTDEEGIMCFYSTNGKFISVFLFSSKKR